EHRHDNQESCGKDRGGESWTEPQPHVWHRVRRAEAIGDPRQDEDEHRPDGHEYSRRRETGQGQGAEVPVHVTSEALVDAPVNVSRRDVLARLAAIAATAAWPGRVWANVDGDPLDSTIAEYVAGLRSGRWSAVEITTRALARCRSSGVTWRAIDA